MGLMPYSPVEMFPNFAFVSCVIIRVRESGLKIPARSRFCLPHDFDFFTFGLLFETDDVSSKFPPKHQENSTSVYEALRSPQNNNI
jgi:hypothetical protein